jgi:hypothetical protein
MKTTLRGRGRVCLAAVVGVAALTVPHAVLGAIVNPGLAGSASDSTTLSSITATAIGSGFASANYAYATNYYRGTLSVLDISNPAQPVSAGESASANTLLNGSTVNIAGGYAYVVSKNRNGPSGTNSNDDGTGNALTILDVSTFPAQPLVVGSIRDPINLFGAYGIAVSGSYAFVAAQGCLRLQPCPNPNVGDSFNVIDISSPSKPTIVATIKNGSLPAPWTGTGALKHATAVAISGNYAYVTATYSDRLTVIDISNPLNPTIVSSLQDTSKLDLDVDVSIAGDYAFVANQGTSFGSFTVVDVHNPTQPQIVGFIPRGTTSRLDGAYRIRLRGNFAYVSASSASALGAVDISNPAAPRYVGSVQSTSNLNKTTGLDVGASGRFVYSTSPYLSTQTQPLYPPYPAPAGTASAVTGTFSSIDLAPTPISVSITSTSKPASQTTLTSASFQFSVSLAVSTPRCRLDGASYGLCTSPTSQTYSGLTPGVHTFQVQATDAAGNSATDGYTWTVFPVVATVAPSVPVLDSFDRADGTVGSNWTPIRSTGFATMNVSASTAVDSSASALAWNYWSPSTYGADAEAYATVARLGASDTIRVGARVTPGTKFSGYYVNVTTTGVWSIARIDNGSSIPVTLASVARPLAAGDAIGIRVIGPVVTALQWTGAGGWVQILTYDTSSDAIRYTNAGSVALEFKTSALDDFGGGTYVVSSQPTNSTAPSISGGPIQGQDLTASPGKWSGQPAPAFTYQWERCDANGSACGAIAGATASLYTLSANDVGSTVRVVVTASNNSGTASAPSAVTAVVTAVQAIAPTNSNPPAVSGSAQQGQTFTAVPGSWSGSPAPVVTLQWQRCDQSGSSCSDVTGATSATYDLGAADVGATIRVVETASNSSGSSTASSATTPVVQGDTPPVNTTAPAVSGTGEEGQTLSATSGSWSGVPPPTLALQWQRCDQSGTGCVDLASATGSTYKVAASDVGSRLRAVVTATNPAGSAVAASAVTSVAVRDATAPTAPTNVAASTITATSATITWSPSSDAVGVTAYEDNGSAASSPETLSGLTCGTSYTRSIVAKDAAGNTSAAGSVTFSTAPCGPQVSDLAFKGTSAAASGVQATVATGAGVGDLVVVLGASASTGTITTGLTDSKANTWVLATQGLWGSSTRRWGLWYSVISNPLVGGTDWIKLANSGSSFKAIHAIKVTGVAASPLDALAKHENQASTSSVDTGTSGATAQAAEIAFAGFSWDGSAAFTPPSGYFQTATTVVSTTGTVYSIALAYRILSASGTQTAQATLGSAANAAGVIATFKLP